MGSALNSNPPDPRLFLVGMGPGPVEDLTLRSWELLASGLPVRISDASHEVSQTLMARGFSVEVFDVASEGSNALIDWAETNGRAVYAVAGTPLEIEGLGGLIDASKGRLEVEVVPGLSDQDRLPASDPLTGTHAVGASVRAARAFARLVSVMARLRAPGGCPWDAEQTHTSLAIHLLEETHETLDAIDRNDAADLEEELGDLLLQIVFHSEIAAEQGHFEIGDVIEELTAKLVHRHPHVFGEVQVSGPGEVVANWEALKSSQKKRTSLADGIPHNLPALLLAHKVQRRLSGAGTPHNATIERLLDLASALGEKVSEEAVAEVLYEVVGLAMAEEIDPEGALRKRSKQLLSGRNSEV